MRRIFTVSIIVLSMLLASTVQAGGLFQKLYFIGLWEGIDGNDGSEAQRSITLNSDGTFSIIGQEPITSGCDGERGYVTGTGELQGGVIVSYDFYLFCYNNLGPYGPMHATYIADKLNGTLIEDFPDAESFEPMIMHKISKR